MYFVKIEILGVDILGVDILGVDEIWEEPVVCDDVHYWCMQLYSLLAARICSWKLNKVQAKAEENL